MPAAQDQNPPSKRFGAEHKGSPQLKKTQIEKRESERLRLLKKLNDKKKAEALKKQALLEDAARA